MMTKKIRRPHTCQSYHRSGSASPILGWGDDLTDLRAADADYLSQVKIDDKYWKQLQRTMEKPSAQETETFAGNSPRDGLDFTSTSQKCNGIRSHGFALKDPAYFYLTSNQKDFPGHPGLPAPNARPKSSKFYPSEGKFLTSSYQEEFCGEITTRDLATRSGLASSHRRNKPHPLENFMVWKFPGQLPPLDDLRGFSREKLEQVFKKSLKSTYQVDYLGKPEVIQVQESLKNAYAGIKSDKPTYTLDSTSRFEYQQPQLHGNLKNNTSRYECNMRRQLPARGAVPNISSGAHALHRHGKTIYSDEYMDKSENAKISQHVRPIVAKRLHRYLDNHKLADKENSLLSSSGRFSQVE